MKLLTRRPFVFSIFTVVSTFYAIYYPYFEKKEKILCHKCLKISAYFWYACIFVNIIEQTQKPQFFVCYLSNLERSKKLIDSFLLSADSVRDKNKEKKGNSGVFIRIRHLRPVETRQNLNGNVCRFNRVKNIFFLWLPMII